MSKLMDSIIKKATKLGKTIVLPEGEEPRIIEAARCITDNKIAKVARKLKITENEKYTL